MTQTGRSAALAAGPQAGQTRRVFIRDLVLPAAIGIHSHERGARQPVRINLDLTLRAEPAAALDGLADVVCYEDLVGRVKSLLDSGHVNLVEALAERLAAVCLSDARVLSCRVRVEKLAAIAEAASVGVEIERAQAGPRPLSTAAAIDADRFD